MFPLIHFTTYIIKRINIISKVIHIVLYYNVRNLYMLFIYLFILEVPVSILIEKEDQSVRLNRLFIQPFFTCNRSSVLLQETRTSFFIDLYNKFYRKDIFINNISINLETFKKSSLWFSISFGFDNYLIRVVQLM